MHEVLAMFNIFYDDRGKGAERTVPVHIINFNFLKLISSLSLSCLHVQKNVCIEKRCVRGGACLSFHNN